MRNKDPLEPSPIRFSEAINQSRLYWHSLLARSSSKRGLPLSCNNLDVFLHSTPAVPHHSEIEDICEAGSLYPEGFSVWGAGTTRCDVNGQRECSQTSKIALGLCQPQYRRITNNACSAELEDHKPFKPTNISLRDGVKIVLCSISRAYRATRRSWRGRRILR